MANRNAPMGFIPRFHALGGEIRTERILLTSANAAIYPGDVLEMVNDGTYDIAEASDTPAAVAAEYVAASSGGTYILAYTDPYIVYSAQTDDGTGTATAQTCVNLNCNFVATAGSGGHSNMELDESSATTTNTLPWHIVGLDPVIGNTFGEFNRLLVIANIHARKGDTGVTGI